jgi:valyl-tRNA synthetase
VGEEAPEGEGWEREPDVLDTWFSTGLWPFATLGWPEETPALRTFYPTDVLSTARDIIFLWVARMVMFGVELTGELPFRDVPIHSVVQAPDGRRMSKSLGTGIDPLEMIDVYGADALRFGLLAMASSQDVRFNEERVKQGRDLANKLWNASRLILQRVGDVEADPAAAQTVEDRWIVSRLDRLTETVTGQIDSFRFSPAALELYGAFWSEVCDWYLELAKPRLYSEEDDAVAAVLVHALERVLTLLHPIMPFVSEEIWSLLPGERGLLAESAWPDADESLRDEEAEAVLGRFIEAVGALRSYRDEIGAKPGTALRAVLAADGYGDLREHLGRLARFELVEADEEPVAEIEIPGGVVRVLASEGLDAEEEGRRREAERTRLQGEIDRLEKKLANQSFVEKAPPEVVEGERRKLDDYREALRRLDES